MEKCYTGGEAYRMEQMSFFEDIDEKKMRRCVIKELKYYKALRVRMQNRQEQNAAGYAVLFLSKMSTKTGGKWE